MQSRRGDLVFGGREGDLLKIYKECRGVKSVLKCHWCQIFRSGGDSCDDCVVCPSKGSYGGYSI
jgi:hypothetical protein